MARKVLIVEDEGDYAQTVALNLRRSGFDPVIARTGEAGIVEARRLKPEIILLDLMLPDVSGKDVCRRLKADPLTRSIPVIMVTARGEEFDRVIGLELGADDYLVKPVSMRELVLRMNIALRRVAPAGEEVAASIEIGLLRIDGPGHRVHVDGDETQLTALEFRLLVALASRPGRVFSRESLLDAAWGVHSDVESRTVDTMMKRLRDKLGKASAYVETVRGVGYRFASEE
jgi:two-component system phosphate regulon response regulator PhoB